jgi:hypothetical protein
MTNGNADVTNWPVNSTGAGASYRGAGWLTTYNENRTSDRIYAAFLLTGNETTGGRGVRTAE